MKRNPKKPITTTTTTPLSTSSSSSTLTTMEPYTPNSQKHTTSCYFPNCRKDANCTCQICLDSINATLDLLPLSTTTAKNPSLRSLRLRSSSSPSSPSLRPIPFGSPSLMSTPKMQCRVKEIPIPSPCCKLTSRVPEKESIDLNWMRFGGVTLGIVVLILGLELGFGWMVSNALRTELSVEILRDLGERAFVVNGIDRKLRMLQSELGLSVNGKISNCTHNPRVWKVDQDGLLLRSRCVLYKSAAEEVSVWGWPLQTAGLLASEFSSRSYTILSGRVTQWPEGSNAGYVTVNARGSWVQDKYRASAVQLDGQTWVIEYRRSMWLEHEGVFSAAWKFLEYKWSSGFGSIMRIPLGWLVERFRGYSAGNGVKVHPT